MTASPAMINWMHALSDITRLRTLRVLERHELTVAELRAVLQLPQSTVSRHLKVLADDDWVRSRREGTSRMYRMATDAGTPAEPTARRLWLLLREQEEFRATAERDDRRLTRVLADRRTRSEAFFSSAAGQWDKVRGELFGGRFDLIALPALLDPDWTVGDLGCGTGQAAEALAPFVQRVVAVDHSAAMLKAAHRRLKPVKNVDIRSGSLEALPIDDARLDAAVICLVLHHLPDPAAAVAEAARVLKPAGRLLIVDMLRHDRSEYQQQMGHVWFGFDPEQVEAWFDAAGLSHPRIHPLPPDPQAKGPALFAATAKKPLRNPRVAGAESSTPRPERGTAAKRNGKPSGRADRSAS